MKQKIPFRDHHILALLEAYEQQKLPLDLFISQYFRGHPALGSKDRGYIAETIYAMIRWKSLLDYLGEQPASWETRYNAYQSMDLEEVQKRDDMPLATKVSFPPFLFDALCRSYGEAEAVAICRASNEAAPTTIRANALKISRDDLLAKWKEIYEVSPTLQSPCGIIFHKKINFFELPEFQQGLFEVQDEGSQLLAQLVAAKPGDQVLDYCSGSGGKSLAIAPQLQGKGQIYLHDIRPFALQEARKRLKRAGIQNSQVLLPDAPHLDKLKKKMNWILVDAPCSGSGTLRRNPDMKWKIDAAMIQRLKGQQRTIFERALSFLHPTGRIVYGTCSLLKEENEEQLDHFLTTYSLEVEGEILHTRPVKGGMDGFFGVVLKRA